MSTSIRMGTQAHAILEHLKIVGSVTGAEAYLMFKSRSTTKRISELRKAGYAITSEWRKDSTGQRYVRYWLDRKTPKKVSSGTHRIASIHPADAFFPKRASYVGDEVIVSTSYKYQETDYVSATVKYPNGNTVQFLAVQLEKIK